MKLMMVEWVDSYHEPDWQGKQHIDGIKPSSCVSVGIAHEYPDRVTLVQSQSTSNMADVIAIPRCAIKRMRVLKVDTS